MSENVISRHVAKVWVREELGAVQAERGRLEAKLGELEYRAKRLAQIVEFLEQSAGAVSETPLEGEYPAGRYGA